jgi:hypothetical protein
VGAIDSTIESGVSKITNALTEPIDFNGIFSSNDTKSNVEAFPEAPPATDSVAATNSVVAPATNSVVAPATDSVAATSSEKNQITGAPQIPSIGGRRRNRRSKKCKKSKNSSKRRTKRGLKKMKK